MDEKFVLAVIEYHVEVSQFVEQQVLMFGQLVGHQFRDVVLGIK